MAAVSPVLRRIFQPFRSLSRGMPSRFYSQPAPAAQSESSRPLGWPWRVVVSVCVQRLPTLSRDTSEIERRYQQLKERVRIERSVLSDFELQERQVERLKRERERRAMEEEVMQESADQTAVEEFEDLLEARDQELSYFQPAPRLTEADQSSDLRSAVRQLDKTLYLLVKKDREEYSWQMPQGSVVEGESLLHAAKRELSEDCGAGLRVDFLSSAPSTLLSYHHPHPSSTGIIGSKVFFLKAQYRGGEVVINPKESLVDHVWLTKEELKSYVSEAYYESVAPSLID